MKAELVKQLRRDEGSVPHAYKDHLGYLTIGVGRLIDQRKGGGLSEDEIEYLLNNDINKRDAELRKRLPWVNELDQARYGVLVAMSFQMGVDGLLGFKNTLELIRTKQWSQAAAGMMNSLWAKQTPTRAARLAKQMQTGVWV